MNVNVNVILFFCVYHSYDIDIQYMKFEYKELLSCGVDELKITIQHISYDTYIPYIYIYI